MALLYDGRLYKEAAGYGRHYLRMLRETPNPEALRRRAAADGKRGGEARAAKLKAERERLARVKEENDAAAARDARLKAAAEARRRAEHPGLFPLY